MNLQIDTKEFKEKGFTLIKNFLKIEKIQTLIDINNNITKKCESGNWPFLSVYKDYPHFFGKLNLFGINYPLHSNLNNDVYDLVSKINIEKCIKELKNWDNYKTTLVRLHVFNYKYNYQGAWHRDDIKFDTQESIQSILYLKDEIGFRVVPKYNNIKLQNYQIPSTGEESKLSYMYRKLDPNIYSIISAKAGDLFVFQSGLLHQGFSLKKRMHYHMRHEKSEKQSLEIKGLQCIENLKKNTDIEELKKIYKGYEKEPGIKGKLIRFRVFIGYFIPRLKTLIKNIRKKKELKDSIFHNTIWQK